MSEEAAVARGICVKCNASTLVNRGGRCLICFVDGTVDLKKKSTLRPYQAPTVSSFQVIMKRLGDFK